MARDSIKPDGEPIEVIAEPCKAVPKLTTKIGVAKTDSNIIISFLFSLPDEETQLIERVVLDQSLVDELVTLLKDIKEME
ncbi:MAG: hypothetical protein JWL85_966 [Candidatus Saccharibacteria bacterium]|nr:hypothetical protein [Candidatus Saccharibacteria bacterium]